MGKSPFDCAMCGKCCQGFGGTLVGKEDIARISRHLGISPEEMETAYCARSGLGTVLAQKPDGYCVFFDGKCSIHPVKPRMCRRWPFIPALLAAPENWRVMASACKGMDPDAAPDAVAALVRETLTAERRGE
jgi:Fe-S-cluster containining protein